jgi:cellobiose-specific phosphotransferase system component IIA
MSNIKSCDEVKAKLFEVEDKLKYIHSLKQKILQQPYAERSIEMSQFLDLEDRIYSAVFKELKWVLNE